MSQDTSSLGPVAIFGTGIMGTPIARRLVSCGREVRAWDIDRDRLGHLSGDGVLTFATGAEAAAGAQVLITMLTDADTTERVIASAFGAFSGVWIQSATVGIDGTERLLALADRHMVTLVDCPLLGTKSSAEAGELIALASGPREAESLCRPVLDAYTRRVLWLGEAGLGSRLKLVMNNWVIGLTALTAETIALAEGLGFVGDDFLKLIEGGPLDVKQAHIKGAMMQRGDFTPALALRHAAKDADLIAAAALRCDLELPLGRATAGVYQSACEAGYGDEDMAAVFRLLARAP